MVAVENASSTEETGIESVFVRQARNDLAELLDETDLLEAGEDFFGVDRPRIEEYSPVVATQYVAFLEEAALVLAVTIERRKDTSWTAIGKWLKISRQAASNRFGQRVKSIGETLAEHALMACDGRYHVSLDVIEREHAMVWAEIERVSSAMRRVAIGPALLRERASTPNDTSSNSRLVNPDVSAEDYATMVRAVQVPAEDDASPGSGSAPTATCSASSTYGQWRVNFRDVVAKRIRHDADTGQKGLYGRAWAKTANELHMHPASFLEDQFAVLLWDACTHVAQDGTQPLLKAWASRPSVESQPTPQDVDSRLTALEEGFQSMKRLLEERLPVPNQQT